MKKTTKALFILIFQLIASEPIAAPAVPLAPPKISTISYVFATQIFHAPCVHTEFGCTAPLPSILQPEIKTIENVDGKYIVELHAKLSEVEQRLNATSQALETSNLIINDLRERLKTIECKNSNPTPPC